MAEPLAAHGPHRARTAPSPGATRRRALRGALLLASAAAPCGAAPAPEGPSFDCAAARAGSTERLICADAALSALDRQLAQVYAAASAKAADESAPALAAQQHRWIEGRNDCWRSADPPRCVAASYRLRIAGLQASYRLLPGIGPVRFACNGNPRDVLVATFFATDPPTLLAERAGRTTLMSGQPGASGARYGGPDASFWEHQGEASVTWGAGAPRMGCVKAP